MSFINTYAKELISLLVPFVTWFINSASKPKAKLIYSTRHEFTFLVQEPLKDPNGNIIRPNQTAHTQSLTIQNMGKETATKIQVVLNWRPKCLNVWPVRPFTDTEANSDRRYTIQFESLAPREYVTLEMLDINNELPRLLNLRSDQCLAREIQTTLVEVVAVWKQRAFQFFALLGLAAALYIAIIIIQFLVLRTPLGYDTARGTGFVTPAQQAAP